MITIWRLLWDVLDDGIWFAYSNVFELGPNGIPQLHLHDIDLAGLTDHILDGQIKLGPFDLGSPDKLHLWTNLMNADANDANLSKIIPILDILPLTKIFQDLVSGFSKIVGTNLHLPEEIDDAISDLEDLLGGMNELARTDYRALFGVNDDSDDVVKVINQLIDSCERPKWSEILGGMREWFQGINSNLAGTAVVRDEIEATHLPYLRDNLESVIGNGLGKIVNATADLFIKWAEGLANNINLKGIVHLVNLVQDAMIWGFAYWGTCVSIAAHFVIIGLIILVIEVWVRRTNLMPDDGASSVPQSSDRDLSSQSSSSSSSSSKSSSGSDASGTSSHTIEYESKRPNDKQAKVSDGGFDTPGASEYGPRSGTGIGPGYGAGPGYGGGSGASPGAPGYSSGASQPGLSPALSQGTFVW